MIVSAPSLPPKQPQITIFVHGTQRAVKRISSFLPPLSRRLSYKHGMHSVNSCPLDYCYRRMMTTINQHSPERFPLEHAHIFCWSGKLSHEARLEAAQELNQALNKVHEKYKDYKLTLLTHSHGGNVALNLAAVKEPKNYHIDTLIVTACPVQEKTKQYVFDPLFQEIYAPYSSWDTLQVADPQGAVPRREMIRSLFTEKKKNTSCEKTIPFFSGRHFPENSKVKHIHITQRKRPISHIEFLLPSFTKKLGTMLDASQNHNFSEIELEFKL